MDKIIINGLKVNAILGIYDVERVTPQPVRVDLVLFTPKRPGGAPDVFEGCVDYEKISDQVRDLVTTAKKLTVEALAEDIADLCLGVEGVLAVDVRVLKTNAIDFTDSVGVEIHRERNN